MNKIAVLLTCHNRKEKTLACLDALFKCSIPVNYMFEAFLVDDGCTDDTAGAVRASFPLVNVINGDGSLYWNRGMRLAWTTAAEKDYDYYIWLNDDTSLLENAIDVLLNVITVKGNNSVVCGATQSFLTNEITYSGFKNEKLVIPNGEIQTCDPFNGNIVLIPKIVFKKVGNLDNSFSHSIGDLDYGMRAKKNGIDLYVTTVSVGYCENNPQLPIWCRPDKKLKIRIKHLYSPLGYCAPKEFFVFEQRHYGFIKAAKHFLSIHLRLLFPKLWTA